MNGNFRKPEFVKRYEYTYYDLETPLNAIVANNARQTKDNYRFVVDNSSEANPIDWYNAYLVDIGEGFWHISTCPTFNRKFKLKIINFHLQPLLAEC